MAASKEADKATRYVALLYEARCNNRCQDVPELARKVDKHAAGRRCLTLAARADALFFTKPGREGCKEADDEYGEALSAALRESGNNGDVLDAATSHAAIFYGKQQPEMALTQIPEPLHRMRVPTSGSGSEAWLAFCVMRGTLIRGLSFEAQQNDAGASSTYRSVISYVSKVVNLDKPCPALRQIAEELITHICLYFAASKGDRGPSMGEAMAAFHVLSQLLSTQSGKFTASRGTYTRNTPRQFWRTYYAALSQIIRGGLVYHPSPMDRDHETLEHTGLLDDDDFLEARKHQRADLRRVEKSYETILLAETRFPKANETNDEIKQWVELTMGNWRVMCGSTWSDEELGEGGKTAVARNTLDILYRAQTKTFHSTQILRYLVTVHAYLAEFDLAFKAFESYVEIITKGKARAKKTGSAGVDLDDDDTAIRLAAEAIRLACRFGSEKAASRAFNIGLMTQRWLEHGFPDSPLPTAHPQNAKVVATDEPPRGAAYSEPAVSCAYRCIGISQATWARYCFESGTRKTLLETAVHNLRTSLRYQPGSDTDSTEAFFALGTILAELGRVEEAITVVGFGLNPPVSSGPTSPSKNATAPQQTAKARVDHIGLLPLHHLQALLLSAGEDYEASSAACEEALEKASSFNSSNSMGSFKAVARYMENFDKMNALEIKMTQITLVSVVTGAERAANASNELIALYAQLFGNVQIKKMSLLQPNSPQPRPKSSSGTIRSMFSRRTSRAIKPTDSLAPAAASSAGTSAIPSRPQTMATAPAINVIDEEEEEEKTAVNAASKTATPKRSVSLQQKSSRSMKKKSFSRPHTAEGEKTAPVDSAGVQAGGAQPMAEIPHNMPDHEKVDRPAGHDLQPPQQDTRLPVPPPRSDNYAPPPQFLALQERQFQIGLLIKVWLFVAQLYAACDLFADADEAITEARTLVEELELELSQKAPSVKSMQEAGWGGGKAIESIWADVYAEHGQSLVLQKRPHDALLQFEKALTHDPNHVLAVTGLANLLLDIYEQKMPSEKPDSFVASTVSTTLPVNGATTNGPQRERETLSAPPTNGLARLPDNQLAPTEETLDTFALYRLAARDRAYGLLASTTALPTGAADAQAWLALSRAHELSGQIPEARAALWRVVDLEDASPVRSWCDVSPGRYVLW